MDNWATLHVLNRALEAAPLGTFACAWVRRHHLPPAFRAVYYYVGIEALFYVLDMFSRLVFRNNVYLYHADTVVLVCCLLGAYRRLLPQRLHRAMGAGLLLFLGVALLDAAVLNGLFTDVNTYSQAFGCALLLALAIWHVLHLTRGSAQGSPLEKQPEFFLSTAVLVYCSSSVVSAVALNIIYHAGYDVATVIRLDTLLSVPDMLLMATQMGLLAWMFQLFPLSVSPRRALPHWLHYSRWHPRHYHLLGRSLPGLRLPRRPRWSAP
ncbi:rhodanese-related sulfurtransferase [Hymenobacter luteus]|uniref:Rhodanese-related sulfurtransferase n=2 Tax=Hymenobacter TaxID=89966 RepID=A0A7W9T0J6_9BACT|nr:MULTISPECIES: hypothetical protein [Hymenobacter]MBB4601038.1 rhodanese-related sulfurtransferase [Hymenobacter latericoloratus]MBB6058755.1 rhodanese-related sulfurtransferase [Hymenobacter luteus]